MIWPHGATREGLAMNDRRDRRLERREFLKGAAALALALPQRAGAQAPSGTLTYASTALPPNIEPHMQGLDIWQQRKPLIYENLIWVDESLDAKPELAERWEQRSPTEYVFHLRRGVRFHDGKELDAEDVKYTYDRVRDPKVSPGANDLLVIKRIDVADAQTVRFVLHAPAATFLINLGGKYNGVIPKGAAGDGRELLTRAIGTGPFSVEEFDPSRRLVVKRHAAYWGPVKPALERVVFQAIPDESSIVAGLRTGQVTMAQFSSALSFQVAKSVAALQTIQAPSTRWVVLDLAGDMEPTSKVEVRQAITLAIDRPAILQIAGAGLGHRLGVLPPGMKDWALPWQKLPNQQRDVAGARALLQKAGYAGRVSMKIRNIVGFPALAATLPVIVDNLREAGIDVQVETVDGGVWIKDWIVPQSPPTMNEWGGFVDPDQAFHRHFHSAPGGKDFRRWNNTKADELLDAGRATLERARRKQIYDQVQRLMAEDPITIPLYSPDLLYAMQKSVKGFAPHPTGFLYGLRWVSL
jgi:peptide/nickel transport system substrate-binding protein